jgi:hypothetical protein
VSVFFAPARYRVVKIMYSYSVVVLRTTKHTIVYPGLGPSLEVIALCQWFDIEQERWLQWGEKRAQEVREVKGENNLVPLAEG